MQIEMIQGKTYVDMLTKRVFTLGVPQEVDDETGTRLLQATAQGIPFFRMTVQGVKPVAAPAASVGSTPAEKEVTPTEQARAMRRAGGAGPVKFGANKQKTGAAAGVIEPPEDGGVTV